MRTCAYLFVRVCLCVCVLMSISMDVQCARLSRFLFEHFSFYTMQTTYPNSTYLSSLIRTYTDIAHICSFVHCLIGHTNIYLIPIFINERHKHEFGYCSPRIVCDLYDRTEVVPTIVCEVLILQFIHTYFSLLFVRSFISFINCFFFLTFPFGCVIVSHS